jgi:hypothetical protein
MMIDEYYSFWSHGWLLRPEDAEIIYSPIHARSNNERDDNNSIVSPWFTFKECIP